MAYYQSGYRPPAMGKSKEDYMAEHQERVASAQTQRMQQQRFMWEVDDKKEEKAKSNILGILTKNADEYDPNHLLKNMVTAQVAGTGGPGIQNVRGFTSEKKAQALDAYRRISPNPDMEWFENSWNTYKSNEDMKIVNELVNDYKIGKISEDEFNMAARDQNFQDFVRKSKLTVEGQAALASIYKPDYERYREKFFGREGSEGAAGQSIVERHPGKTTAAAAVTVGAAYGVEKRARRIDKATKAFDKATKLSEKYKKLPEIKNPKWSKTAHKNTKEFIWDKSKGSKTKWLAKQKEVKENLKSAKLAVEEAKKFRLAQKGGKIAKSLKKPLTAGKRLLPMAAGFTAGEKTVEALGGGEIAQTVGGLTASEVARRLTKPKTVAKLMPLLKKYGAGKVALKLGASMAGYLGPQAAEPISTALGIGGTIWAAYDIIQLAKAVPEIAKALRD
jgi:hypothetical protein